MDKIIVQGGNTRLSGEVVIEGAKNAVLPLLAATILASEGQTTLTNVPILSDVYTMNNVVRGLDIAVDFDEENNTVVVDASGEILDQAPYEYVSKMRASIVVLGPTLARNGHAKVWKLWELRLPRLVATLQQLLTNSKVQLFIWTFHLSVPLRTL